MNSPAPHPRESPALLAHTTTSGMLLAAAATPFAILQESAGTLLEAPALSLAAAALVVSLSLLAAYLLPHRTRAGQILATLALLGALALGAPLLVRSPAAALAALVATVFGLAWLWQLASSLFDLPMGGRRPPDEGRAQGAALAALALWSLWAFADLGRALLDTVVVGWALGVSTVLGLTWVVRRWHGRRGSALTILLAGAAGGLGAWSQQGQPWWMLSSLLGVAASVALLVRPPQPTGLEQTAWWEPLLGHPARLLVGTFAGLCFGGMVLLALPQSAATGHSIGFLDALFTSTSAVCVTGLVVLDTPVDFTLFGQVIILLLIQVGGLGIMTFSTTALWALGRRMSLRYEGAVASLISPQDRGHLFVTAKRIVQLTVFTEAGGALLLAAAFAAQGDRLGMALWRGLFTSISAFCNAGFALQSDSLVPYQHSPAVLHLVALLIIAGGLSPMVLFALPGLIGRRAAPVAAQVKLGLVAAAALLIGGGGAFLALEWAGSLSSLPAADRLHNAWFQVVTLRTAGFNSIDLTTVCPATLTLMMLSMFIGGAPGSTAGGVKTTTAAVLVLSVIQTIRGRPTLEAFGKLIPERTRAKAAAIVVVAAIVAVLGVLALQLTQRLPTRLAAFEVVSALGTVGLSLGGTARLDGVGKLVIAGCMFVGRVGGLTLLMFASSRDAPRPIGRPEEEIDVG
ncbi:MAG: potassium transporter TrkG [Myxococcota bacterium]|nr:potassium transporter TrkG [Myxococcota bacterium]